MRARGDEGEPACAALEQHGQRDRAQPGGGSGVEGMSALLGSGVTSASQCDGRGQGSGQGQGQGSGPGSG